MKKSCFSCQILMLVLLTVVQPVNAKDHIVKKDSGIFIEVESFSYSEPAAIKQLIDSFEGPEPDSGEVAFTFNKAAIGGRFGSWEVAVFTRYDYLLEFNSDTVELVYREENDLPFPIDRTYHINLEPNHIQANGISLAKSFQVDKNVIITPTINYLDADSVTRGYLRGEVSVDEQGDYEGELLLNYIYEEDILLDREQETISGKGYSIDFSAYWQINDKLYAALDFVDLYSEIQWDDVTFTQARANTNNVIFDNEGRLQAVPLLSGIESFRDFTQTLPFRGRYEITYNFYKNLSLTGEVKQVEEYLYPRLALGADWGRWGIAGGYQFETEAIDLRLITPYLDLFLAADSSDYEDARSITVGLSIRLPIF